MAKAYLQLLALLLLGLPFLAFANDVPVMTDVDYTKLAGKWYPVETIKAGSGRIESHAFTLKPTADGRIVAKVEIPKNGACSVIEIVGTQKRPGVFGSSDGETTVMDTDYKTYLFTYISAGKLRVLELYGRKKEVPKEIKKKFNTFVKKVGMKPASRWKVWKKAFCKSPSG